MFGKKAPDAAAGRRAIAHQGGRERGERMGEAAGGSYRTGPQARYGVGDTGMYVTGAELTDLLGNYRNDGAEVTNDGNGGWTARMPDGEVRRYPVASPAASPPDRTARAGEGYAGVSMAPGAFTARREEVARLRDEQLARALDTQGGRESTHYQEKLADPFGPRAAHSAEAMQAEAGELPGRQAEAGG